MKSLPYLILFTALCCGGASSSAQNQKRPVILQTEAQERAQSVSEPSYDLTFNLDESSDFYQGSARIHFSRNPSPSQNIFLEFADGQIDSLTLDGKNIPFTYDGLRIQLAAEPGPHKLEIHFHHPYSRTGEGFYASRDPADGKRYVYTKFEPYLAGNMFPCFDQPDLKARFKLDVIAPEDWTVISNTAPPAIAANAAGAPRVKRWSFPQSSLFSTYLFAVVAGPYHRWDGRVSGRSGEIPMGMFSRESLAQYVDAPDWFKVIQLSLPLLERVFDHPFVWGKYDQILVPDFNSGAMENVAAVTFNEMRISRSTERPDERLKRVDTQIHELVHMWWGNLATMQWWDDLWLNESFATFMSLWVMEKLKDELKIPDPMEQFFSLMKTSAYSSDGLTTTHPIVGTVRDSDEARGIFDNITYGKGASVLWQLLYFLGEEPFFKGMSDFFRQYAFKNPTREDFFRTLAASSGKDLSAWQNEWLKTSGTNRIRVKPVCSGTGELRSLSVQQDPDPIEGILRTHRTQLGLYNLGAEGQLALGLTLPVTYRGAVTEISIPRGTPCPELIFPNLGEYDHVNIDLDRKSMKTVRRALAKIPQTTVRQSIWFSLRQKVVLGEMAGQNFIRLVLKNLGSEPRDIALKDILAYSQSILRYYMAPRPRELYSQRLERLLLQMLADGTHDTPRQIILFQALTSLAHAPQSLEKLETWLEDKDLPPNLKIDQVRRWEILTALARNNGPRIRERIEREYQSDKTDSGEKSKINALASIPDPQEKRMWLEKILGTSEQGAPLTLAQQKAAMTPFQNVNDPASLRFAAEAFFDTLPALSQARENTFFRFYIPSMFPAEADAEFLERVDRFLTENPQASSYIVRLLKEEREFLARRLLGIELSGRDRRFRGCRELLKKAG